MIREERFLISRRPYAAALDSLRSTRHGGYRGSYWRVHVDALWFRRKDRRTQAVIGGLWGSVDVEPADGARALTLLTDGRYGGAWVARWDGESYVSEHPQSPEAMERHLALLRPMLENYPAVPAGWDGWWTFGTSAEQLAAARALRTG